MDDDIRQQLDKQRYEAAFGLLLERFRTKVFRLAFSLLRNETQAEDASQDAWVRIWKGLPGYTGAASLSTWIYTITRNTCLTELNRRKTHPTTSLDEANLSRCDGRDSALTDSSPTPGAGMDVAVLLNRLPDHYRRVITLFYLEQRAYEEVAAMLGLPIGTVKTYLFRAKKELLRLGSRESRTPAVGAGSAQPS
jgi:RNA polymerase sigma-70 factor, ECF subfamily